MKIAVFSDIHGNLEALQSILEDINIKGFDEVIYLGDAIGFGPQPKECLELLKQSNVKFVLGNHELYFLRGTEIDDEINDAQLAHMKWVKSCLDDSDREYLSNCPLYYEAKIDYEKIPSNKILFAHWFLKDINAPYPFEYALFFQENHLDLWQKYNNQYYQTYIGHEHKRLTGDDIVGANNNFTDTTGDMNNILIVGSSGCTKDDQTWYTSIEIGKSIITRKIDVAYNKNRFIETLKNIDYPYKEIINGFAFGINDKIR